VSLGFCTEANRALNILFYREFFVGDRELRDVANFRALKITFFRKVATIPENAAVGLLIDSGDQF